MLTCCCTTALLVLASTSPCPPGTVVPPKNGAEDLFAPDPGCEVEAADPSASLRVVYRGRIGTDRSVTVDITRVGGIVGGFIVYDQGGDLLGLGGSADANGNTVLTEFVGPNGRRSAGLYDAIPTERGEPTGKIVGRLTPSALQGTWKSPDGKTKDRIALDAVVTSDRLPAGKGNLVAYPVFEPRVQHARLNAEMREQARQAFAAYRKSVSEPCTSCSFERTFFLESASDDLVSLMIVTNQDTGSSHTSSHACLTLRTANNTVQQLTLGNLFTARAGSQLAGLIAAKLRGLGHPNTTSVEEVVSRTKSSLAEVDSFALTPAGVKLVVDTSSTDSPKKAPYAVLLPYSELRELVRRDALALLPDQ